MKKEEMLDVIKNLIHINREYKVITATSLFIALSSWIFAIIVFFKQYLNG